MRKTKQKNQNETIHNKTSGTQKAGKKQRSTMDSIIMVNAIIEQKKIDKKKHKYILCRCRQVF